MRELLLGYLMDALEPGERAEVESLLREDPNACEELENLRQAFGFLDEDREEIDPPHDLADRTCDLVAERASFVPSDQPRPPGDHLRIRDYLAAACLALFMFAVLTPAVMHARFTSQLGSCRNNLRQIGQALSSYSYLHQGNFPHFRDSRNQEGAGIYAPILCQTGFLEDSRVLVCPTSALAEDDVFQVPTLQDLKTADARKLRKLRRLMGGSYGYTIGYVEYGRYLPPRNLERPFHPVVADSPSLHSTRFQSDNHGGFGQNVLFERGEVVFLKTTQLRGESDHLYTNKVGHVAPGVGPNDAVIGHSTTVPVLYARQ